VEKLLPLSFLGQISLKGILFGISGKTKHNRQTKTLGIKQSVEVLAQ